MKISVNSFKGSVPIVEPRLLGNNYAQTSINARLDSGNITPYNTCSVEQYVVDADKLETIYKYKLSSTSSVWLKFTKKVFIVNDPIFADTNNRAVITGLDAPRIFDIQTLGTDTTITAHNSYLLGLVSPSKPTLSVTGTGTGTPESRSYVIQYDRNWSDGKIDAGPWSPPGTTSAGVLTVDVLTGQSAVVSNIEDAPAGYGITHITINRTATATSATDYQFVKTFNIADAKAGSVANVTWDGAYFTFTDTVKTTDLGYVSSNKNFTAPPAEIEGLISLNNGILAAFKDNYIYFSEPYQCHAWPDAYKIAIDRNIVGLGSFGSTLVVCTDAEPQIITVSDPASSVDIPIKEIAPCATKYGIVSFRDAVVYPSYEGFIRIDSAGIANITQSVMSSRDISAMGISNMSAVGLDNKYYGIFLDTNNQKKVLVIDMASPDTGVSMIDSDIDCAFVDKSLSSIYVGFKPSYSTYAIGIMDKGLKPLKYIWRSKIFVLTDSTTNLSAARVQMKPASSLPVDVSIPEYYMNWSIDKHTYNFKPINGIAISSIGRDTYYVVFKLYADGSLVFSKKVYNSKPFRLPSGYTASEYEFEISGYLPVYGVDVATAMSELSTIGGEQ